MRHDGVLVKCGGFATQLSQHVEGAIDGDPLWSARFDSENPDAVIRTHLDFLENGAQIILSNTYQASVEGFTKHLNKTVEEGIQLIKNSVQLAKIARKTYLESLNKDDIETGLPLVMASIGPYGAHLSDASEYKGNYAETVTPQVIKNWHRTRIAACVEEGVDGLAVETIPCQSEAEAVVELICDEFTGVKFWVCFQCKDEKYLAHGQYFSNAVKSVWNIIKAKGATNQCIGIGVNCVQPKNVSPLLKSVQEHSIPFVVYSNRGERYHKKFGWVGAEQCKPLETYVPEWIELGAKIIGGCCRVYPSDILRIRECIDNIKSTNPKV